MTSRNDDNAMISQKKRKENMVDDAITSTIEAMNIVINETIRFFLQSWAKCSTYCTE